MVAEAARSGIFGLKVVQVPLIFCSHDVIIKSFLPISKVLCLPAPAFLVFLAEAGLGPFQTGRWDPGTAATVLPDTAR
jgi:hypothetical protein